MKGSWTFDKWMLAPSLAAAPLCYPPLLFWPRPGLENIIRTFGSFSFWYITWSWWLFLFSPVGHLAGNLCYRTSWGHRIVLTPRQGPPPPPLWGLISFPHISNLLEVNYPLPPNSQPHSYCVPHHHCPYSSQSGAGRWPPIVLIDFTRLPQMEPIS